MTKTAEITSQLSSNFEYLLINKKELEESLDTLFHQVLFPICNKNTRVEESLNTVYTILVENISSLLGRERATELSDIFITELPSLQKLLILEAENFLNNDPAAESVEEVIIAYPGFFALVVHRLSHALHKLGVPLIPRLFSEYAHSKVGIDIHPAAKIGELFYIDHGTGIVIGGSTEIGRNVKIYQGVTLGALFVSKNLRNSKRHPTIGDNVIIYAGATILGGETNIGHDTTIGGNVWLTKSVYPYSIVFNNSESRIKNNHDFEDPIEFYI